MGTLSEKAQEYFASLNPLAKKIIQETEVAKKQRGEEWESLTSDQQDDILDNYFIDPNVKDKYQDNDEYPPCYPRLKINCGEKIVVDFDNDGWTWRDEHSAPFSWYSRSEQDLTILDLEDVSNNEGKKKEGKKAKGKKKGKKPRPPPPPPPDGDNRAFKPEKSIWESPFLAADRGLDSGYPSSSHASDHSRNSMEDEVNDNEEDDEEKPTTGEPDVTLSPSKVSTPVAQVAVDEETKLLDNSFESSLGMLAQGIIEDKEELLRVTIAPPRTKAKKKKEAPKKAPPPPPPADKHKKKQDNKRDDGEVMLMTELSVSTVSTSKFQDEDGGQVSPVFVEDPGESTTDPVVVTQQPQASSVFSFSMDAEVEQAAAAGGGQVNLGLEDEDWNTPIIENSSDGLTMSGFDFLDNW